MPGTRSEMSSIPERSNAVTTIATKMKSTLRWLVLALALVAVPALAGGKASFGFATSIETEGFFMSPKVKQVKVTAVHPKSPAETAGLRIGDIVISVNGRRVPGGSAKSLGELMSSFSPGDHLEMQVQRSGSGLLSLELVATAAK